MKQFDEYLIKTNIHKMNIYICFVGDKCNAIEVNINTLELKTLAINEPILNSFIKAIMILTNGESIINFLDKNDKSLEKISVYLSLFDEKSNKKVCRYDIDKTYIRDSYKIGNDALTSSFNEMLINLIV